MKRTLLLSGAAVVIVLLGALWLLYSSLDFVVKEAIEKYGSQATGTSVRVASVSISLTSGRGTLRGVRIANPPGFSSGDAFAFGEVTLEIDVGTVTDDPVGARGPESIGRPLQIHGPALRRARAPPDTKPAADGGVARTAGRSGPCGACPVRPGSPCDCCRCRRA